MSLTADEVSKINEGLLRFKHNSDIYQQINALNVLRHSETSDYACGKKADEESCLAARCAWKDNSCTSEKLAWESLEQKPTLYSLYASQGSGGAAGSMSPKEINYVVDGADEVACRVTYESIRQDNAINSVNSHIEKIRNILYVVDGDTEVACKAKADVNRLREQMTAEYDTLNTNIGTLESTLTDRLNAVRDILYVVDEGTEVACKDLSSEISRSQQQAADGSSIGVRHELHNSIINDLYIADDNVCAISIDATSACKITNTEQVEYAVNSVAGPEWRGMNEKPTLETLQTRTDYIRNNVETILGLSSNSISDDNQISNIDIFSDSELNDTIFDSSTTSFQNALVTLGKRAKEQDLKTIFDIAQDISRGIVNIGEKPETYTKLTNNTNRVAYVSPPYNAARTYTTNNNGTRSLTSFSPSSGRSKLDTELKTIVNQRNFNSLMANPISTQILYAKFANACKNACDTDSFVLASATTATSKI